VRLRHAAATQQPELHRPSTHHRRTRSDQPPLRRRDRVDQRRMAVELRQRLPRDRPHAQRLVVRPRHEADAGQDAERPGVGGGAVSRGQGGAFGALRGESFAGCRGLSWITIVCLTIKRPNKYYPEQVPSKQPQPPPKKAAASAPDRVGVPLVRLHALAARPPADGRVTRPRQYVTLRGDCE